jgi:hypothetical protein
VANRASSAGKDVRPFTFPCVFSGEVLSTRTAARRKRLVEKKLQLAIAADEAKRLRDAAEAMAPVVEQLAVAAKAVSRCPSSAAPVVDVQQLLEAALAAKCKAEQQADTAVAAVTDISNGIAHLTQQLFARQDAAHMETLYELHGVVVHVGPSQLSGHYVSYGRGVDGARLDRLPLTDDDVDGVVFEGKDDDDGASVAGNAEWLRFNDAAVERVALDEVLSPATASNVYCLFYTLRQAGQLPEPAAVVPRKLRQLVDAEDLRQQLRVAQRLSSEL